MKTPKEKKGKKNSKQNKMKLSRSEKIKHTKSIRPYLDTNRKLFTPYIFFFKLLSDKFEEKGEYGTASLSFKMSDVVDKLLHQYKKIQFHHPIPNSVLIYINQIRTMNIYRKKLKRDTFFLIIKDILNDVGRKSNSYNDNVHEARTLKETLENHFYGIKNINIPKLYDMKIKFK